MELRDRIADLLANNDGFFDSRGWEYQPESVKEVYMRLADQILALIEQEYEPVQLEPLTNEEIGAIALTEDDILELEQIASIGLAPKDHIQYKQSFEWLCNSRLKERTVQATIAKNQKEQLYRKRK